MNDVEIVPTVSNHSHLPNFYGEISLSAGFGQEGVTEVWLTSEDTGAYGLDIGSNIAKLLHKVAELLDFAKSSALFLVT